MTDLNNMSDAARKAAMKGGTAGWGQHGSATEHIRYAEPWPKGERRGRRKCSCGCEKMQTHIGKANGIALMGGCELTVRRWVKTGRV